MSVSVDLFVGGPNGVIDWIFKTMDDAAAAWTLDSLWQAGVHIMGSRTYHDMAAYWPASTEPFAQPMNEIPKIVFSRHGVIGPSADNTTTALKDARRANPGRKTSDVKPAIVEGWEHPRIANGDLVDEYRLRIHPVVLENGLSLFSLLHGPLDMKLVNSTTFKSGVIANIYWPA